MKSVDASFQDILVHTIPKNNQHKFSRNQRGVIMNNLRLRETGTKEINSRFQRNAEKFRNYHIKSPSNP